MSERPHRVRTWAPKGKTPVLQYSFTWNQLSAVAGVSFWNIYFKLVKGAVRAPEIVAFLKNLRRHLTGRKLLIVWDRLQAHRSRLVRDYVEAQGGAIQLEFLPPYAPELNPVEYLWAHWKHHEMPNFCPRDFADSAPLPAPSSNVPSAAKPSSRPSGNKPSCLSDVTLLVKDQ